MIKKLNRFTRKQALTHEMVRVLGNPRGRPRGVVEHYDVTMLVVALQLQRPRHSDFRHLDLPGGDVELSVLLARTRLVAGPVPRHVRPARLLNI